MEEFKHAPYSPDLALCDFEIFGKLKNELRGKRFKDRESVLQDVQKALQKLYSGGLQNGYKKWVKRCKMCISAKGEYFEDEQ